MYDDFGEHADAILARLHETSDLVMGPMLRAAPAPVRELVLQEFERIGASDLAALNEAVAPIYAQLEQTAGTSAFLDEIRTPEAAERHERHDRAVAEREAAERQTAEHDERPAVATATGAVPT